MNVVVFGGSGVAPYEPVYYEALELGARLAKAGHTVINGGYYGLMGAVSKGASSEGGSVVGVTCKTFDFRDGHNPWLSKNIVAENTMDRLERMLRMADVTIAMPGSIGTLNEILMLMTLWKVYESSTGLFCRTDPFEPLLDDLRAGGWLDQETFERIEFFHSLDDLFARF